MTLAFLPLYIRFLGVEAYGLIGVFVSLMALFSVFDLGLSTALSRELARLSARPGSEREARDLTRTLEIIYWGVGLLIGGAIAGAAPIIAHRWLNAQGMEPRVLEQAVAIMGLVVALQWPVSLYSGGLIGLQRQVLLNMIRIGAVTLQTGGAVLILWLISPTILAYFTWQILVSMLHTSVLAWWLGTSLPGKAPGAFHKGLLLKNWRFAGGMTGIALLTTMLTQADKVVLSKMLPLEAFGYYALAATIAGALTYISNPVYSALFPRFSQLVGGGTEVLTSLYHKGSQLMALLVLPAGVVGALFSRELLLLWFGDQTTAARTSLLASLLVPGTALNCLLTLPYMLQLAHGWTGLSLYKNLLSVLLFLPLLVGLVAHYGAEGAAYAWLSLNVGYLLFEVPVMHRRLLRRSLARWYLIDVGLPVALSLGIGLASRVLAPSGLSGYAALLWIGSTFALTLLCVALAMPHSREWLKDIVARGMSTRRSS